jgi:RNA polymerase sigma-70 factor (ECF subfamily)
VLAQAALEHLCSAYWYPLYAFVRRRGYSAEEAEDLTQEFFLRLITHDSIAKAREHRGRFRSYLLGAMKHFLASDWHHRQAQKRGGGRSPISFDAFSAEERYRNEPADPETPEALFDRRWALTLIERALEDLRCEAVDQGNERSFAVLRDALTMEPRKESYKQLARRLGTTEGAVKTAVHRLRVRYRKLLRSRIADTVESEDDIDHELDNVFAALAR